MAKKKEVKKVEEEVKVESVLKRDKPKGSVLGKRLIIKE